MKTRLLLLSLMVLLLSCKSDQRTETLKMLHSNPVYQLSSYDSRANLPFEEKLSEAPQFVLDYLREMDNNQTYQSYILSEEELKTWKETVALLPSYMTENSDRLIGIYFIENFQGFGLTDIVLNQDDEIYNFMVINPDTLHLNLSEAIEKKESTAFSRGNSDIQIHYEISEQYKSLLYILLHETIHVLSYKIEILPFVEPFHQFLKSDSSYTLTDYEFLDGYWSDHRTPLVDRKNLIGQNKIRFYNLGGPPLLNLEDAPELYSHLSNTPFCSLYSTLSWSEDLAEYLTFQYLVEELGCTYTVKIMSEDRVLFEYDYLNNEKIFTRGNWQSLTFKLQYKGI